MPVSDGRYTALQYGSVGFLSSGTAEKSGGSGAISLFYAKGKEAGRERNRG